MKGIWKVRKVRGIKNYYGKWWTKIIAMLLCVVTVLGIVVSTMGLFTCGVYTKEQFQEQINSKLCDGYATVIATHMEKGDIEDRNLEDEIPELQELNLEYAVIKSDTEDIQEVDLTNKENYVAGDIIKDYDSLTYLGKEGYFRVAGEFFDHSLISAITQPVYIYESGVEDQKKIIIDDFVYSRADEMLFAETAVGYFPLDEVMVYRSSEDRIQDMDESESRNLNETDEADQQDAEDVEIRNGHAGENDNQNIEDAEIRDGYVDEVDNQDIEDAENSQDFVYENLFTYEKASGENQKARQVGTDMYSPDVKYLSEDYLNDSLYIYFRDEVLYWNQEKLFKACGVSTLQGAKVYFGDSVWPVKFVDKIKDKKILQQNANFVNESEKNRGWVYYVDETDSSPYYWIATKYVENGVHDLFADAKWWVDFIYQFQNVYGLLLLLSVIVFLAGFVYLLAAAGVRKVEEGIHLTMWHRLPWAVYTFGMITIEVVIGLALGAWITFGGRCQSENFWIATMIPIAMIFIAFAIIYCMNMSVRIKSKQFWRFTLWHYIVMPIRKHIFTPVKNEFRYLREHTSFMRKTVVGLVIGFFVELAITLIAGTVGGAYEMDNMLVLFFFIYAIKVVGIVWIAIQMNKLQEGSSRVAAGRFDQPIDTNKMFWEFKKHGEYINSVGDGISAAVQDRMKSEHFKTELITNVSHDIKTPLTSIINYVDLIKKQELTDPTMIEYVEVLDRQSARLKKLIEDLMEASKASTGNLAVNWEKMDVTVMLTQVVGEFEERLSAKGLELIVDNPTPPINVRVDGRHLWRIFDNLMNNICKYAQAGTRVYINVSTQEREVSIVFRNISAYQLNISSEELMERFVRGDSSRNTEGSGLGLSIAQSLTELMKGTMDLKVDGDLFKVILKFPLED